MVVCVSTYFEVYKSMQMKPQQKQVYAVKRRPVFEVHFRYIIFHQNCVLVIYSIPFLTFNSRERKKKFEKKLSTKFQVELHFRDKKKKTHAKKPGTKHILQSNQITKRYFQCIQRSTRKHLEFLVTKNNAYQKPSSSHFPQTSTSVISVRCFVFLLATKKVYANCMHDKNRVRCN